MSQENQSSLRFSLEETLWFRKGQEVEELVSISLDPDITIQENDQYVTIRGSLELTGEYNSFNEDVEDEEEEIATNQKYVQSVEARESGLYEFLHRFPVDITIPYNRIQSIYDIDVLVESFDYTIPERSCLKLSAELTISGLYGVQQSDAPIEVLSRIDASVDEHSAEPLFTAEARKLPEEESLESPAYFPTFPYEDGSNPAMIQEMEKEKLLEDDQESQEESIEILNGKEVIFEESTSPYVKEESSQKKVIFHSIRNGENQQEEFVEESIEIEEPVESGGDEESSSSSGESHSLKGWFKKKTALKKKSMSLTEFFSRKVEEEEPARLRVCLVQKGDTLDRLAERYDITISNLLKANHLDLNQDVCEGQVLYIPNSPLKK